MPENPKPKWMSKEYATDYTAVAHFATDRIYRDVHSWDINRVWYYTKNYAA